MELDIADGFGKIDIVTIFTGQIETAHALNLKD